MGIIRVCQERGLDSTPPHSGRLTLVSQYMSRNGQIHHSPVGASLLAMDVNDNAENLTPRGVFASIASRLAPTGDRCRPRVSSPADEKLIHSSCTTDIMVYHHTHRHFLPPYGAAHEFRNPQDRQLCRRNLHRRRQGHR
ncbi:hypothetical protein DKY63_07385 [Pseudomonas putida]|uniref:Uncharacterized protein n=1 Tax=Pseudomonas putida TaxID=303 RepID=A0A2Z4RFE0_PSEPU|nr:hypothetical protein DKY63_07385 [Pseudomonas putida]